MKFIYCKSPEKATDDPLTGNFIEVITEIIIKLSKLFPMVTENRYSTSHSHRY